MPRLTTKITVALVASLAALACAVPSAFAQRNLYVSARDSGNLSLFDIDVSTGGITAHSTPTILTGSAPSGTVVDPSGRFLYLVSEGDSTISVYAIDQTTGDLTLVEDEPESIGVAPRTLAITPNGEFLYVVNVTDESVQEFSIDQSTGELTAVGAPIDTGAFPYNVVIDSSGRYLYVTNSDSDNVSIFSIDGTTGVLSLLGTKSTGDYPLGMATDPSGLNLYVGNYLANTVSAFRIDPDTGGLTDIGTYGNSGLTPYALTVSPDGQHLYLANTSSSDLVSFSIDQSTGALGTASTPVSFGAGLTNIVTAPSGNALYTATLTDDLAAAFSIDSETGEFSQIGSGLPIGSTVFVQAMAVTPNQGPVASASMADGVVGDVQEFDATASSDSDGSVASYSWDFGDGSSEVSLEPTISHTYTEAGDYTVSVTVTDNEGCSDSVVWASVTAYCNGSSQAVFTGTVTVEPAPIELPPTTTTTTSTVTSTQPTTTQPTTTQPTTTQPPSLAGVLILATEIERSLRNVDATISCGSGTCIGTATIYTVKKYRLIKGKKKKIVTLGSASFSLDSGSKQTVKIKLSKRKLKKLLRKRGSSIKVELRILDSEKRLVKSKLTLKKGKAK